MPSSGERSSTRTSGSLRAPRSGSTTTATASGWCCRLTASSSSARGSGSRYEPPVKVALLTREFPPEVYGGAGVHVEYLSRELARLADVTVHCWGADRGELDGLPPAI